jgi:hypothetical protein
VNSVSGSGLQAAANSGNGYMGGSELYINGTIDLSAVSSSNQMKIMLNGYTSWGDWDAPDNWDPNGSYQWDIVHFTNGVTGSTAIAANLFSLDTSGLNNMGAPVGTGWTVTTGANDIYLNYNYVPSPEPGTIAMLLSGVLALIGFGWRRRK